MSYFESPDTDSDTDVPVTSNESVYSSVEEAREASTLFKTEANSLFTAQNYEDALKQYNAAIQALKSVGVQDAVLHLNRAATYLALKRYVAALHDSNTAIRLDPENWKGHWRKGLALMGQTSRMFRTREAITAFEAAGRCESYPANKRSELQTELCRARARLQNQEDASPPPDLSRCVPS